MRSFARIVVRDLRLAARAGTDAMVAVMFFLVAVALFPLALGPEPNLLARMAAGVVWVAALLASMLSLERLFQADYDDGSLDLLALAPLPLEAVVLAKAAAHWLVTGLPLIVAGPVLAVMLRLPAGGHGPLAASLLLGTPSLSLMGALGAALVLGARRGGVLISLLVLPLLVPALIFATGAIEAGIMGLSPRPHLLLLSGLLALAVTAGPVAAAAALRQSLR